MTHDTNGDRPAPPPSGRPAGTGASPAPGRSGDGDAHLRAAVVAGVVVGVVTAALPLVVWWLPDDTVYAVVLAVIASIYVGFAVADGRARVIAAESVVALGFVTVAAVALADVAGASWLLVGGIFAHGLKDLWQHRTHFVSTTRWWPPFCVAVDWVAAAIVAVALLVR